jgi:L-ornithine Nalpha-acyltransferase
MTPSQQTLAASKSDGWGEIRAGNLAVHIATKPEEIRRSQELRYRIFFGEMGGVPSAETARIKRDFDKFDDYCDHLLVRDYDLPRETGQVVGTYRLLRRSALRDLPAFYSESEFDISPIKKLKGEILELGRSCVDANYRNRAVMQLLWRGIGAYVTQHNVQLMFGCASFFGTDVAEHALPLSYLHHYHLAPEELRSTALPDQYIEMNLMPKSEINVKKAFAALPALIKGYLRLSGYIGHGAVLDPQCKTIDVGIIVKTDLLTDKYVQRYAARSTSE